MVLDIAMPGTDGYELLSLLRREARAAPEALPAIALTGFASVNDASRAQAAGFQRHLSKPFEPEKLRRHIAELAAAKRPSKA
jgi:CheY-like chemotaxis protein